MNFLTLASSSPAGIPSNVGFNKTVCWRSIRGIGKDARHWLKLPESGKNWGYTMIDVVYDACVLHSGSLRDLLLHIAATDFVQPHWSNEIHEEWIGSLVRRRPDVPRESLERTRRWMDTEFENSLTKGYEPLIPTLELPDPDDRHVLAVAIFAEAKYIVTTNLEDFPKASLQSYGIEAVLPDDFIWRLIQKKSVRVLQAVKKHRASLTRPPKTVEEYLATLEKQGLHKTVAFLRERKSDL